MVERVATSCAGVWLCALSLTLSLSFSRPSFVRCALLPRARSSISQKTLVLSNADGSRSLVSESSSVASLKQAGAVLELWDEPRQVTVVVIVDAQEFELPLLLDFNVDLGQQVVVVHHGFKSRVNLAGAPCIFSLRVPNEPGFKKYKVVGRAMCACVIAKYAC